MLVDIRTIPRNWIFKRSGHATLGTCALLLLGAFALFSVVSEPGGNTSVDRIAYQVTDWLVTGPVHRVMHPVIDNAGDVGAPGACIYLALILATVLVVQRRWLAAGLVLVVLILLSAIELVVRAQLGTMSLGELPRFVVAPRTEHFFAIGPYPSGHVARTMLLASIEVAMLPRALRRIGAVAAIVTAGLCGLSRIHGGQHTGSDVVGGILLGAGLGLLWAAVLPAVGMLERQMWSARWLSTLASTKSASHR